jgi:hypothetical protein
VVSVKVGTGEEEAPPFAEAPYEGALQAIRSTAQWLVAAFSALGAVLLGGAPFTAVANLDFETAEFWLAIGGLAIAVVSIVYVVPQIASVFTYRFANLTTLRDAEVTETDPYMAQVRRQIDYAGEELYRDVAATLPDLFDAIRRRNEVSRGQVDGSPVVDEQALRLAAAGQQVVSFANYEVARRRFREIVPRIVAAAVVVGVGVVSFIYFSNQPQEAEVDAPTAVTLSISEGAAERLGLGDECDRSAIEAVAIGGTFREPEVVTRETTTCRAVRFTLKESDGVAVPAASAEGSPSTSAP